MLRGLEFRGHNSGAEDPTEEEAQEISIIVHLSFEQSSELCMDEKKSTSARKETTESV